MEKEKVLRLTSTVSMLHRTCFRLQVCLSQFLNHLSLLHRETSQFVTDCEAAKNEKSKVVKFLNHQSFEILNLFHFKKIIYNQLASRVFVKCVVKSFQR